MKGNKKNEPIIVTDMTVTYRDKLALDQASVVIEEGKLTGIIGPNGAGKSTLMKGMMGLVETLSGEVTVGSRPMDDLKKEVAYVEQRSQIDLSFPILVKEVVLLGTYPRLGLFKRPRAQEKEIVAKSLAKVQMTEFANRQIGELSGGQLQRVFIARAIAQDAQIIFLDEPFVGIDMVSEKVIIDLLKELRDEGRTLLIVHHDLQKATDYFDNLIILNKKVIAAGPVSESFTTENMQKAYGDSMGMLTIQGVK